MVVNGVDLGTFSNVEPIRKPLLRRLFGDDSGNLYEGREDGDFTEAGVERMQIKTNETTNDRSDLRAVASALRADDGAVVAELERVIDLEQFRRFWALEILTGNWDSYSGNTNNFYLYHDPTSDRFVFLPWGTDVAFTGGSIVDSYSQTLTVYATGALANRLYNIPAERAFAPCSASSTTRFGTRPPSRLGSTSSPRSARMPGPAPSRPSATSCSPTPTSSAPSSRCPRPSGGSAASTSPALAAA